MEFDFEFFKKSADYVKSIINDTPEIAIILGTGLGGLAKSIENPIEIKYEDIPNFLISTNQSHAGKLIFGKIAGRKVICMSGRFHYYEGYSFEQLVIPIRLFKLLGVQKTIVTNAAGAINESYNTGDIMIIKDHIKLTAESPLRGKNIDEFGPRFFDVSDMYTKSLREKALECAEGSELDFHEGVYILFAGPQFETPAEIRAAKLLGADAVGMSTVTEALTAAHCSMPFLAFSVISNMAAGVTGDKITDEEVDETAGKIEERFSKYMEKLISEI